MFPSLDFIRATRRFFLAFSISTVVCLISKRCITLLIDSLTYSVIDIPPYPFPLFYLLSFVLFVLIEGM